MSSALLLNGTRYPPDTGHGERQSTFSCSRLSIEKKPTINQCLVKDGLLASEYLSHFIVYQRNPSLPIEWRPRGISMIIYPM